MYRFARGFPGHLLQERSHIFTTYGLQTLVNIFSKPSFAKAVQEIEIVVRELCSSTFDYTQQITPSISKGTSMSRPRRSMTQRRAREWRGTGGCWRRMQRTRRTSRLSGVLRAAASVRKELSFTITDTASVSRIRVPHGLAKLRRTLGPCTEDEGDDGYTFYRKMPTADCNRAVYCLLRAIDLAAVPVVKAVTVCPSAGSCGGTSDAAFISCFEEMRGTSFKLERRGCVAAHPYH